MAEGKIEHRDVAFAALGMGIALAIGLGIFVFSGVYNVSAARPHLDPTVWVLDILRKQSVWFHSRSIEVPPLDDPGLIGLGAMHYEAGCSGCHAAPGERPNAVTEAMLPPPPILSASIEDWTTKELFWIVQNGQKYTGMPAWTEPKRSSEIWSVVAFLTQLPGMDAETYRTFAGSGAPQPQTQVPFSNADAFAELVASCDGCHGTGGAQPVTGLVPVIAGQLASYLDRTLRDYRSGTRGSGIMQLVASTLSDAQVEALAEHYAGDGLLAPPSVPAPTADEILPGASIFSSGIPAADVPACIGCHENGTDHSIPRLLGQPATFIKEQLHLFQEGVRGQGAHGQLMAPIAQRLTPEHIEALATYIASAGTSLPEGAH